MTFRIAVVQPICHRPGTDVANVADAARAIARAADEGAQFVCFPETYPGPWRMPATFDPTAAMVEAAAKHKTHVVFGTIAPIDAAAATAHNLICMAAGKDKNKLWATWRALIWARAIENLAIVVTTQNLFDHSERGLAMVASPEEILFESTIAGTAVVDVNLERLRYLRATRDQVGSSETCAAKQGVLGPQWQRPELYDRIYPRPLREAAE